MNHKINNKTFIKLLILGFLFCNIACSKWIDVEPSTQVREEKFFEIETGFKNLLNGIYITMGNPELYGREMNFGLVDILGQQYTFASSSVTDTKRPYIDAINGLYMNEGTQRLINGTWSTSYNILANINVLLHNLEKADRSLFAPNNFDIIKGEALALRAFLHFDMLRLFSTAFAAGGADQPGIPYLKQYSTKLTPRSTAREAVSLMLADLQEAEGLLKVDPLLTAQEITLNDDDGYLMNRSLRFNYYAVKALQARVYLWRGDKENALLAAQKVIEVASLKFPWVLNSALTASEALKDRTFTTEYIFGLYQQKMLENTTGFITDFSRTSAVGLLITSARRDDVYPPAISAADIRRAYLLRADPMGDIYFGKLYQTEDRVERFARRMPIIRIPEMYYIAAECLAGSNPSQAVDYLNTVRIKRGVLGSLDPALSEVEIEKEIQTEMRKEYPSEGQMFYYYKRLNKTTVPGFIGTYDTRNYVLPLPLSEIEYGL